jgi:uncharacterized protein YbaP (TraB family)
MTLRRLGAALSALLCFVCAASPAQADEKEKSVANSLLWRISGKGLTKPSYVFGTIHAICEDDYFWTPIMQSALDSSEKLCLEIDMDNPMAIIQSMAGMMSLDGPKLKDYFTPAQYKRLERYAEDSLGLNSFMLQMMKPAVLMTMLSGKGNSCDKTVAYEMKLMEAAKEAEQEILGLESVKEQMDLLNSLPVDSIVKDVMDVVDGRAQSSDGLDKLIAAYKQQNLTALDQLMTVEGGMTGSARGPMLDDRNIRWIPRMEKRMKEGRVFFAVGAGHLPGKKGVLTLLREAGYTVTPMMDDPSKNKAVPKRYKI